MQNTTLDKDALAAQALDALRQGQPLRARQTLERIVESGSADASTHVAIAFACRALKDPRAAMLAIDRAIALDPRNLQALIIKGDYLGEAGDARGAAAFFRRAVGLAPPAEKLPPELRREVDRAAGLITAYAAQFESHLERWLDAQGFGAASRSPRFRESLELLFGRKQIYFQSPRYYYFPGLPQIQFYDRAMFPWLESLEAHTDAIRGELIEVMKDDAAFRPYVEGDSHRPQREQAGMLGNPAWSAFYLWKNGERIEENARRCPLTMKALEVVPLTQVANRSPSVLFSLLRPGAHIPAHNGMVNTRLIGHLPLIVPGTCTFRVGNEVREWQEGRAWMFDDTIEHEAWNRSLATRVVLLFEVWKPELGEEERRMVNAMFEAIDAHSGEKPQWEI